jgi:hypothetical protein
VGHDTAAPQTVYFLILIFGGAGRGRRENFRTVVQSTMVAPGLQVLTSLSSHSKHALTPRETQDGHSGVTAWPPAARASPLYLEKCL